MPQGEFISPEDLKPPGPMRPAAWEEADVLYGVTMQEKGVSRILTINLNDIDEELNIK